MRRFRPMLAALVLTALGWTEAAPAPQSIINEWFQAMSTAYNYGNATPGDLRVRTACELGVVLVPRNVRLTFFL